MLRTAPRDIALARRPAERGARALQPGQCVPRARQAAGPCGARRPGPLPAGGARLAAAGHLLLRVSAFSTLFLFYRMAVFLSSQSCLVRL